ncbi:MAG: hypothetical protein RJA98_3748 [Pseudomonadota bacterium]|jgi:hypothetical protein
MTTGQTTSAGVRMVTAQCRRTEMFAAMSVTDSLLLKA